MRPQQEEYLTDATLKKGPLVFTMDDTSGFDSGIFSEDSAFTSSFTSPQLCQTGTKFGFGARHFQSVPRIHEGVAGHKISDLIERSQELLERSGNNLDLLDRSFQCYDGKQANVAESDFSQPAKYGEVPVHTPSNYPQGHGGLRKTFLESNGGQGMCKDEESLEQRRHVYLFNNQDIDSDSLPDISPTSPEFFECFAQLKQFCKKKQLEAQALEAEVSRLRSQNKELFSKIMDLEKLHTNPVSVASSSSKSDHNAGSRPPDLQRFFTSVYVSLVAAQNICKHLDMCTSEEIGIKTSGPPRGLDLSSCDDEVFNQILSVLSYVAGVLEVFWFQRMASGRQLSSDYEGAPIQNQTWIR